MKPDKIFLSLALLIILTTISWISSCTHKTDISNMPAICFKRDVMAIIGSKCTINDCHNGNGESLDLTSPEILRTVVPYNADASQLYKAITSVRGEIKMPPDQPIAQESRTIIRLWIEQGADTIPCPDNKGISNIGNDILYNK